MRFMDWATLALLSAASFGAINIIDKYIVVRVVKDMRTLPFILGPVGMLIGAPTLLLDPDFGAYSSHIVPFALAGGMLRALHIFLVFKVLETEEVSRAVPVSQIHPIFVALLAGAFLGEVLGVGEWLAIIVVVAGAVLLSARRMPEGLGAFLLRKSFGLLVLSSLLVAVANLLGKEALGEMSVVQVFGINFFSLGAGLLLFSLDKNVAREAWSIVRTRPRHLGWFAADQGWAVVASFLFFSAVALGPVSLASTLTATRPFFIFVFAVLLSWRLPRFLEEPLTPATLAVKFVGIAMIVGGTARLVLA
jgi:drug/metabolite transporter (DMT)-like permease